MKIGASTLAVFKYGLYNCLGFYEDNNIEYVELLHDYPLRDMDTEILNSFNLKYTGYNVFLCLSSSLFTFPK